MKNLRWRFAAFIVSRPLHFFQHAQVCFSPRTDIATLLVILRHEIEHARMVNRLEGGRLLCDVELEENCG